MSAALDYSAFLATKAPAARSYGVEPATITAPLFDFQKAAVEFAVRKGRAALFLDTGLGKTLCELEFCRQAILASALPSLILTPLAVARQIEREATRFGYDARVIRERADIRPGINICNYDRLDKLDPSAFGCVALDESSILKSFNGATTRALIEMFSRTPFRLAATATPAPNDHMELGQHAEFLGIMPSNEMLMRWFISDQTEMGRYRLKGHAVTAFWDWMASWAVMAATPADLGYDASRFVLPPMTVHRHVTMGDVRAPAGALFMEDLSATNIHQVKHQTAEARAGAVEALILQEMEEWITSNANGRTLSVDQPSPIPTPITASSSSPRERETASIRRDAQNGGLSTPTESAFKTTSPFFNSKTEPVQSAEPARLAATAGSTSIIATLLGKSGDYSVIPATSRLGHSETIQRTSAEPRGISKVTKMPAWVLWCDTNEEQSILERKLGEIAISITGAMQADTKTALHEEWLAGKKPVLITKPTIFGFGVNWQHCARMAFVGRSFSYEAWYQAVRRCWRFGQTRPVEVHIIVAEGEDQIGRVIARKADDHAAMKDAMRAASRRAIGRESALKIAYAPTHIGRMPSWLSA